MTLLTKPKTVSKVVTIFWHDAGKQAFMELLAVFGTCRGKTDVLYEGESFLVIEYRDNCLDGRINSPFDVVYQDSVEDLMKSYNVDTKQELIGALAHDDELIVINQNNPDDEDFKSELAEP